MKPFLNVYFCDLQSYIKGPALKKPALELAWETFLEIDRQQRESINSKQSKISN